MSDWKNQQRAGSMDVVDLGEGREEKVERRDMDKKGREARYSIGIILRNST